VQPKQLKNCAFFLSQNLPAIIIVVLFIVLNFRYDLKLILFFFIRAMTSVNALKKHKLSNGRNLLRKMTQKRKNAKTHDRKERENEWRFTFDAPALPKVIATFTTDFLWNDWKACGTVEMCGTEWCIEPICKSYLHERKRNNNSERNCHRESGVSIVTHFVVTRRSERIIRCPFRCSQETHRYSRSRKEQDATSKGTHNRSWDKI